MQLLLTGFAASFCATFSLMIVTIVKLYGEYSVYSCIVLTLIPITDSIQYNELAHMCWVTNATPTLIAVWASPVSHKMQG